MPCSIVSAWNIFFEALKERSDFYGMTFAENEIHPLPEVPCAIAIGGMLKRHLAARTLEQLLKKELMTEEEKMEKNSIQNFIDRILDGTKEGTKK